MHLFRLNLFLKRLMTDAETLVPPPVGGGAAASSSAAVIRSFGEVGATAGRAERADENAGAAMVEVFGVSATKAGTHESSANKIMIERVAIVVFWLY